MYKRCPSQSCQHTTHNADEMLCPTCGEKLVIQLERDDRLEDYCIRQAMHSGIGGMGTVYRARHVVHRRNVAVKIAHGKPYQYDALELEAECLARLDHPGIVRILPLGTKADERYEYVHKTYLMGEPLNYIVLEWLQGRSLKVLLEEEGLRPVAEAVRIVTGVSEALTYAHAQGVVHLDLKPANIMIDETKRRPVLMDLGIARRLDQPDRRIAEKNLGTAGYMAPEHVRNESVDARSDIFSLGIVLYELVTGMWGGPFGEGSTKERLRSTLEDKAPRPSSVNRALGRRWDHIIERALAKNPERRYPNMDAFRQALLQPQPMLLINPVSGPLALLGSVLALLLVGYLLLDGGPHGGSATPVPTAQPPASLVQIASETPKLTSTATMTKVPETATRAPTPTEAQAARSRAPTSTLAPMPTRVSNVNP
jgi:serine/threonine protein kinase